jgi:hypothetical protein
MARNATGTTPMKLMRSGRSRSELTASGGSSHMRGSVVRSGLPATARPDSFIGNAGRCPKHWTTQDVREQVVMLRRGKYDGFNDQHFTEKLAGLVLSRETG